MPSTRRSIGALKPLNANIAPTTPGTKVKNLKAELKKKDVENKSLRTNIQDLTNAIGKLELVKAVEPVVNPINVSNNKKDPKAPVPAKTAYKFFCDAVPTKDNMLQVWKETDAAKREPFMKMAAADKERYSKEFAAYKEEKEALEMYYQKKKQDQAMAFYEAYLEAQAALNKAESGKNSKKITKDPYAPKRPTSSFMYFAMETRASVVKANPDAKPTEVTKILGSMWNKLDKKSTKKFEKMAETDRERYVIEKEAYDAKIAEEKTQAEQDEFARLEQEKKEALELMEATRKLASTIEITLDDVSVVTDLSGKKKKKKKDPNAPKRALTAYNFFFTENRDDVKSKMPAETINGELMAEIGRQWKALSESKKKKYNTMADKDKARYAREMAKYTANKA